jgi:uncharacterized coiled-coil DUF342 family protein
MKDFLTNLFMYDAGTEGGQGGTEPSAEPAKSTEPKTDEPKTEPKEQMIPKHRFDEVYKEMKALKEQVDAYNAEKAEAEKKALEEKQEFKTLYEQTQNELNTYKQKLSQYEGTANEYQKMLDDMVATKLNNVPEEFRSLVPEGMTATQKLDWLNKAEETGLFKPKEKVTEIGKPMNIGRQKVDTKDMSPRDLLKFAFSSKK